MKQIMIIAIAYMVIFVPVNGVGGENNCFYSDNEKIIHDYLKKSEVENIVFFVSEFKDNDRITILIVEVVKHKGFLIEKRKCVVENIASISYSEKHKSFIIEEVHGGVFSYNRAENLLEKFDKNPFYLFFPDKILLKYNIRKSPRKE